MNSAFQDPQFLAALAMGRGVAPDQAIQQAALFQQQQQEAMRRQAEFEQNQYMKTLEFNKMNMLQNQLPKVIEQISSLPNPELKFQALINAGMDPKEALLVLEKLNLNTQNNTQTSNFRTLTQPEITKNAERLQQNFTKAQSAKQQLELLKELEDAYREYDSDIDQFGLTKTGSILSQITPNAVENFFLSQKQLNARDKIDKVTQTLADMIAAEGGNPTDQSRRGAMAQLPTRTRAPEARKSTIENRRRMIQAEPIREVFERYWSATHGGDLTQAPEAFQQFLNNNQEILFDESGNPTKQALKLAEEIAKGEIQDKSMDKDRIRNFVGKVTPEQVRAAIAKKKIG